jgi:beta-xylosidase
VEYSVDRWTIDQKMGNSYRVWVDMGEPQKPSPDQLQELRDAARIDVQALEPVRSDGSGKVAMRLEMQTHSVVLVELSRV